MALSEEERRRLEKLEKELAAARAPAHRVGFMQGAREIVGCKPADLV